MLFAVMMFEQKLHSLFRKVYMLMKSSNEKNWVKLLPIAVALLNKRKLARLGGVAPESVQSFKDDPLVRDAQEQTGTSQITPDGGTWKEQNERQNEYISNPKNAFQLNSFVYLDIKPKTFAKSFLDQVMYSIFF
jgi:hypothetical protein